MQQCIDALAKRKKNKTTALRFTSAELEQLEATANLYRTNKSEVIRLALLNLYNALDASKNNHDLNVN